MKTIWNFLNRDVTVKVYVYLLDTLLVIAAVVTIWGGA